MDTGTPAGWYTDPNNAAQQRYWDGQAWTDNVSPLSAQPQYGPAPAGQQLPVKQKHTTRNVLLIVLGVLLLLVGGCTAFVVAGANNAVNNNTTPSDSSCQGKTYADKQADHDHCADASNAVVLDGVRVTATPLKAVKDEFGGKLLCSNVAIKNNSDKNQDYNPLFFNVQTPNGAVGTMSTLANGSLDSGTLIPGGTTGGSVCVDNPGTKGQYVMIYKPDVFSAQRGIWLTTV